MSGAIYMQMRARSGAEDAKCIATIGVYEAKGATVVQMREYAGCVHRIHGTGEPWDPFTLALAKLAVLILLLSLPLGGWLGWGDRFGLGHSSKFGKIVSGAILTTALMALGMIAIALAYLGATFITGATP